MRKKEFIAGLLLCLFVFLAQANVITHNLPCQVNKVKTPVILLTGKWDFRFSAKDQWEKVFVPGELAMQGFAIEHDTAYRYRRTIKIPKDFVNKLILLRFDGVYSKARLWVNNHLIGEHRGGFTRWEKEISSFVKPGKKALIELEVIDEKLDISFASGYAHHPIGGILRDVTLYALPKAVVSDFTVKTLPDASYSNFTLNIEEFASQDMNLQIQLIDPKGKTIIAWDRLSLKKGLNKHYYEIKSPYKWDAEHPNLYTLSVIAKKGDDSYSFQRKIGFRDVQIIGNKMLVNGKQVKLRGACRHDIHPTLGRTTTAELDSLDVLLFKRSNMNFVRTSHYPPTERFLQYCDKMGLYVECETAICFVNTYRQKNYAPGNSENDSLFTSEYMGQMQEMVKSFRNNPSVLFWSIGNESSYGSNFQKTFDWTKENDTTRPVVFSYGGTVAKGKKAYELLSFHYPSVQGTMNQFGLTTKKFENPKMPSLFDEWAHVPCYTYATLQDDPNIRSFWGESLDRMWGNLFKSPGGLGGAIWGFIDETFMLPIPHKGKPYWITFCHTRKPKKFMGNCVGYGEWGIIDVWRREKPEFWGTKKAYSPIRLLTTEVKEYTKGEKIRIPIYNRFDHTYLNEVKGYYTYQNQRKEFSLPRIAPHHKGVLVLPNEEWTENSAIFVEFFGQNKLMIDTYSISLGMAKEEAKPALVETSPLKIEENDNQVIVYGKNFTIPFNKKDGLIQNATVGNKVVIQKGPFFHLDLNVNQTTGAEVRSKGPIYKTKDSTWQKKSFSFRRIDDRIRVLLIGNYEKIGVTITLNIYANGVVEMDYSTENVPNGWLREAGLKLYLSDNYNQLKYKRKGYWSYYPEKSLSGNEGCVNLNNKKVPKYGENPNQRWEEDTHNYYYFADKGSISSKPLINSAKSMKENIYFYKIQKKNLFLQVLSPSANLACRMNRLSKDDFTLYINNRWDYPEIAWGNYWKSISVTPCYGKIKLQIGKE